MYIIMMYIIMMYIIMMYIIMMYMMYTMTMNAVMMYTMTMNAVMKLKDIHKSGVHYDDAHYDDAHYDDSHYDDAHCDDAHYYNNARYCLHVPILHIQSAPQQQDRITLGLPLVLRLTLIVIPLLWFRGNKLWGFEFSIVW